MAEIQVKAGEEEAVKKALLAMVSPTRKEPGCLCYNLHQSKKDKTVFMFYEQWASQAAFDAHGKTPHMAAMRQAIDGKVEKVRSDSLPVLEVASFAPTVGAGIVLGVICRLSLVTRRVSPIASAW